MYSKTDITDYIKSNKYSVAANGTFYRTDIKGFLPSIIEKWFAERSQYKKIRDDAYNDGNLAKYEIYDKKQYTKKIQLNSFYGVLALMSFRFYDIDNAEAVTSTGQLVIKTSEKCANQFYNKIPKTTGIDYCIYVDTDSVDGNSRIITGNGIKTIATLFDELKISHKYLIDITGREFIFPTDQYCPYYDEQRKIVEFGTIYYIEKHKVNKKQFKITTKLGKSIIMTSDHSLMILENNMLKETSPHGCVVGNKLISMNSLIYNIDEIESIEDLGVIDDYMYDIGMVETPHTFFANDILVHNSLFLSSLPIIETYSDPNTLSKDELIEEAKKIATAVQDYINKMYPKFTEKYLFSNNCKLKTKQENIASAGVWKAKKRYAQWLVYKDGLKVDELDVKGIEIVRSDFPKVFQEFMKDIIIKMILDDDRVAINNDILDFKRKLRENPIKSIMYSTGVNFGEYEKLKENVFRHPKGTPVHVKASFNYNDLIKYYSINARAIRTKSKIKWAYVRQPNEYNISEIALSGYNDPPLIEEFVSKYFDYDTMFENGVINKIQEFFDIFGWGKIILNDNVNKFFSF